MSDDPHTEDAPHAHPHDHHEGHDHHHPARADDDEHLSYYQTMEIAVRELLIEKGIFAADDVRGAIERMDARTPALGARMVARAWLDSGFKTRLLADGSAAAKELEIDVGPMRLVVVENKPDIHHLVVCTLCSCYPRMVLGIPPDWYKSRSYRSRAVREPRALLREFGTEIADDVEVCVLDSTADMRYLVMPMRPAGTDGWSEQQLAELVTRDSMVGVTRPAL
jgi:nitrile hydratase